MEDTAHPERSNFNTDRCYHCGDACDASPVLYDQKPFCCEGCKMVYSILSENNLETFYTLNDRPGTSQKDQHPEKYEYLEDEDVISKLIDFRDKEQTRIHFYLPQIHCSSCIWLLEHLHLLDKAIIQARVNFLKRQAFITFDHSQLSLRQLVELLARIGYPPLIRLDALDDEQQPPVDKAIYYKLGLAGFVFGNVMLLSFPEYLGLQSSEDARLSLYFGYINLALIIPVLLYSGKDYFISAWEGLRQKHLNIDVPVSLGILALFLRSAYEIIGHTGAGYLDSLAGLIFFLLIGKWFQQITYNKIHFERDYKSYFPISCNLVTEKGEKQIPLNKLEKGDRLYIRHGELIPADSILLEGPAHIDYSFVTGESDPVEKKNGDLIYAGGRQTAGLIKINVIKDVSGSYLTQLWNDNSFNEGQTKGSAIRLADWVARIFTAIILTVATITLLYWLPRDVGIAINAFSAVLIIACPCAVALSIPFTFGNAVRVLTLRGIYLKNINVLETLAKVQHIVFDKTGTLTSPTEIPFQFEGDELTAHDQMLVRSLAMQSIHPKSKQIAGLFPSAAIHPVELFEEVEGFGTRGRILGTGVRMGSRAFIGQNGKNVNDHVDGQVYLEVNNDLKGAFTQVHKYRIGLKEMIANLTTWAGISVISGDNDRELEKMHSLFGRQTEIKFDQKPKDKLKFIKELQKKDNIVAMIGDGLNDAGALKQSDVGIAVTDNTSYFSPSCDIIMEGRSLEFLPRVFAYAKRNIFLVYCAYLLALLYNVIGLSFAVQGLLSPVIAAILMPASSVTIVLFGVASSSLVARHLGLLGKNATKVNDPSLASEN